MKSLLPHPGSSPRAYFPDSRHLYSPLVNADRAQYHPDSINDPTVMTSCSTQKYTTVPNEFCSGIGGHQFLRQLDAKRTHQPIHAAT